MGQTSSHITRTRVVSVQPHDYVEVTESSHKVTIITKDVTSKHVSKRKRTLYAPQELPEKVLPPKTQSKGTFLKRKFASNKVSPAPKTLYEAFSRRIPEDQCVLLQTFKLISSNKSVITLEDLERFVERYSPDAKLDYHMLREGMHRATNSYEITYDQFLRIMSSDSQSSNNLDDSGSVASEFRYESPRSLTLDSDDDTFFTADSHSDWDVSSERSEDFAFEGSFGPVSIPNLDTASYSLLHVPESRKASTVDLRQELEMRKLNYGIFKNATSRSFTGRRDGGSHMLSLSDKNTISRVARSSSLQSVLGSVEKEYRDLSCAFRFFDRDGKGFLSAEDIAAVMEHVGLPQLRKKEVAQLFKLVGKKQTDNLSVDEFVRLYGLCKSDVSNCCPKEKARGNANSEASKNKNAKLISVPKVVKSKVSKNTKPFNAMVPRVAKSEQKGNNIGAVSTTTTTSTFVTLKDTPIPPSPLITSYSKPVRSSKPVKRATVFKASTPVKYRASSPTKYPAPTPRALPKIHVGAAISYVSRPQAVRC